MIADTPFVIAHGIMGRASVCHENTTARPRIPVLFEGMERSTSNIVVARFRTESGLIYAFRPDRGDARRPRQYNRKRNRTEMSSSILGLRSYRAPSASPRAPLKHGNKRTAWLDVTGHVRAPPTFEHLPIFVIYYRCVVSPVNRAL